MTERGQQRCDRCRHTRAEHYADGGPCLHGIGDPHMSAACWCGAFTDWTANEATWSP